MALVTTALARTAGRSAVSGPQALLLRNFWAYRRAWVFFVTGFAEPVFYLFSIGIGIGAIITGFTFHGEQVGYQEFVAPGMLAASAMNGAVLDATFNVFFKLKYEKMYDSVLATPLTPADVARGEISWAALRAAVYAAGFLAVMTAMGLVGSWWAVLALPSALLVGFAFAAVGMALTTYMKSWQDFEVVLLALMPMFLFSATFYPLSTYGPVARWVVEVTPLYRAVILMRELCTGLVTTASAVSVLYLLAMGAAGLWLATRRLGRLLLT